jgi:hypothetical protein
MSIHKYAFQHMVHPTKGRIIVLAMPFLFGVENIKQFFLSAPSLTAHIQAVTPETFMEIKEIFYNRFDKKGKLKNEFSLEVGMTFPDNDPTIHKSVETLDLLNPHIEPYVNRGDFIPFMDELSKEIKFVSEYDPMMHVWDFDFLIWKNKPFKKPKPYKDK